MRRYEPDIAREESDLVGMQRALAKLTALHRPCADRSDGQVLLPMKRARDRKLSCARSWCRRRTQRGASDRNRADRFGQLRSYFSRRPDDPSARIWIWDAGSRHRRHRALQSGRLRRQRGELTGYSSQIRLLSCGTLRERLQHSRVLLLRQLNILQCRADGGIRYRD